MEFNILSIWKWATHFGFALFEIDTDRDDELCFALLGFVWESEERILQIDLFWKYFEFNFKKQVS